MSTGKSQPDDARELFFGGNNMRNAHFGSGIHISGDMDLSKTASSGCVKDGGIHGYTGNSIDSPAGSDDANGMEKD